MLPKIIMLDGRKAAGPRPCRARQKLSITSLTENPATNDQMDNHANPATYTG